MIFRRGAKKKEQLEKQRERHEQQQDERIDRIEAEVQALSNSVHKQPNLKVVGGE